MFDFRDVAAATKAEQIRAYAVEQAIDSTTGVEVTDSELIKRSEAIEEFILNKQKEA